jgi:hypothetical protein
MLSALSSLGVASRVDAVDEIRSENVPTEDDIARWAAVYEGLPADMREALDEHGRELRDASRR